MQSQWYVHTKREFYCTLLFLNLPISNVIKMRNEKKIDYFQYQYKLPSITQYHTKTNFFYTWNRKLLFSNIGDVKNLYNPCTPRVLSAHHQNDTFRNSAGRVRCDTSFRNELHAPLLHIYIYLSRLFSPSYKNDTRGWHLLTN